MKKLLAVAMLLGIGVSVSGCASSRVYVEDRNLTIIEATVLDVFKILPSQKFWRVRCITNRTESSTRFEFSYDVYAGGKNPPLEVGQKVVIELLTTRKIERVILRN